MIAKRVEAPKSTPTFLGIANYIADAAKQKDLPNDMRGNDQVGNLVSYMAERKGAVVRVTNCNFDNTDLAIKEIQSVQSQNTRSKREKTYHLVVSLAEGERPGSDILRQIEDEIVDHIGLGDHQRISAVHTNTDNWHIHIAINKVHPVSYRNVEPYFDHFKLREKCQELEIRFDLQRTNGIEPVRKPKMNKAQESENHTGIESLATWIQKNVADSIKEALQNPGATWKGLHRILNKNGLILRPRGAGFVFQDIQSGQTVKASTIDRVFAKKSIEKMLGPYQEPQVQHTAEKSYNAGPRQAQSKERDELWSQYSAEKLEINQRRSELFGSLKKDRKAYLYRALTDIKNRKQETYKSAILNHRQKRQVLASLQLERLKVMEKAKNFWQKHKAEIENQNPYCTWTAFLQRQVKQGNETALGILRQKGQDDAMTLVEPQATKKNYIDRAGVENRIADHLSFSVDKKGRINYKIKGTRIVDTGKRIFPESQDKQVLLAAIQLAVGKYGQNITVKGNEQFVDDVKQAVKEAGLRVKINGEQLKQQAEHKKERGQVERG